MKEVVEESKIEKGFSAADKVVGRLDGKKVLVKKLGGFSPEFVRHGEVQASIAAADFGVGPKVHDHEFPGEGTLGGVIMDFIEGSNPNLASFDGDSLARIVGAIKKLHAADTRAFPQQRSVVGQIKDNLFFLESVFPRLSIKLAGAIGSLANIHKALSMNPELYVCHNDIQVDNVFFTPSGETKLIDWEFAGVGNPFVELGLFANLFGLDESAVEKVLDNYREGRATDLDRAQLYLGQQIHLMLVCTFALAKIALLPEAMRTFPIDLEATHERYNTPDKILQGFYTGEFAMEPKNLHLLASVCLRVFTANFSEDKCTQAVSQLMETFSGSQRAEGFAEYYLHVDEVQAGLTTYTEKYKAKIVSAPAVTFIGAGAGRPEASNDDEGQEEQRSLAPSGS